MKMWKGIHKRGGEVMGESDPFNPTDPYLNGDISGWILVMNERMKLGDTIEIVEVDA